MSNPNPIGPRLRASWQRSERYGVCPERVEPVFIGAPDTGSLLYECGHLVLSSLHSTLADEPVSLMLADRDGLVLSRYSNDTTINGSLDRVHLAPGFHFTEREAGTNGLGLALADRAPSLVKGHEHYCTVLRQYTCAAVPVLDPITADLVGSVNLTTWSDRSSRLLLALAQAAAANTAALMLVRAGGRWPQPASRGEVFRVQPDRPPSGGPDPCSSRSWTAARTEAGVALAAGQVLAVVGEPGAGKRALAALARHDVCGRERVLSTKPPGPEEVDAWLAAWVPELVVPGTCIIVSDVELLPAWAVGELARSFALARRGDRRPQPFVLTATDYAAIPEQLATLVDAVVEVPALRFRTDDVMPLARFFARQERHRDVAFSPAAAHALTAHDWPENVRRLKQVVRDAASRADVVEVRHLPAEVFSGSSRQLGRLEILERDEIVRCLTEPGATVVQAASALGIGRATLYRKIAQYDIRVPGRSRI